MYILQNNTFFVKMQSGVVVVVVMMIVQSACVCQIGNDIEMKTDGVTKVVVLNL